MANFARLCLGIAALPFAWGVFRAFVDVVHLMPAHASWPIPPGLVAVLAGLAAYLAVAVSLPPPVRLYVLGHELTHALWGVFFGARVSNLRVGLRGGSVTLTKSNVWITLSPYFFPFYTILLVLVALVVRVCAGVLPVPWFWQFAVGFTWCFHCVFTLRLLGIRQPDVQEYGRVFSYVLIWIFNVAGAAVWIASTSNVPWRSVGRCLLDRTIESYAAIGAGCRWLGQLI